MYCILRMEKIKNRQQLKSAVAHNFRTMPVPNADPEKLELNLSSNHSKSFVDVVSRMENNFFKHNIEPRANSVQAVEFVLSASPEFFKSDSYNQKDWLNQNLRFFKNRFGDDNILSCNVHFDESTPHIHIIITPITKDGRLSCKDLLGGKQKLSQLQTDYAKAMLPFNLKRGIEKSTAKHTTIKQFYALANKIKKLNKEQLKQLAEMLSQFDLQNSDKSNMDNEKLLQTINKIKPFLPKK